MWPAALAAAPVRELLAGVPAAASRSLRYAGLPESEIAATLRELGAERDLSGGRGDDLPAPLRAGGRPAAPCPGAEALADELHAELAARHAAAPDQRRRHQHRRAAGPGAAGPRLDRGHRRVLHRRACWPPGWWTGPARRPTSAGGVVAYSNAAKTGAARRAGRADRRARRGVAAGGAGAGRRGAGAVRRRRRGRHHRGGRPGRRHRGQAGGLRLPLRHDRRRHGVARDPSSAAAAPTSASAPPTSPCTCSCVAAPRRGSREPLAGRTWLS